jgi:hypothetical protein
MPSNDKEWKKESEIRQMYRKLIRKAEKEGRDTSRLKNRLQVLDRKLWSRRKLALLKR